MSDKVLIIDDEALIREEVAECLTEHGYECFEASSASQALELLREDEDITVAMVDIRMPGISGLEMIAMARADDGLKRELEYIIITGHGETDEAIDALQHGVMDFLQKPVDLTHLVHVVDRAQEMVNLKKSKRFYEEALKADVSAKTLEIRRLLGNLELAYEEALDCLATAAEYKDPETGEHSRRIGEYAKVVAEKLGWSKERQKIIHVAAELHDVGKVGTPETVLVKPAKLTSDELSIVKQHSEIGHRILARSKHPVMQMASSIALGHHERWDGGGYPSGFKGEEVPLEARITSLVDTYDALRSKRPYKPAFDHEKACSIILDGDGRTDPSHFDPQLLAIFRENTDQFDAIFTRLAD